jgi:DNA repair photolyase
MEIEKYKVKSLVRTTNSLSLFSWAEAHLNPYQGCYHNCVYCDGKAEYYHMHEDFGTRIRVKTNADYLLKEFLKKKGVFPYHQTENYRLYDFLPSLKEDNKKSRSGRFIICVGGGICDVYQPAEKEVKITLKLLEILYNFAMPVRILTKSNLVLRDLELLKKINHDSNVYVNFTITLADDDVQKIFEPHASSSSERFEAIKQLRKEGIHSGIYLLPTLPFIGDTEENMKTIYKKAKSVGAEFVYCGGLTLKPGRNKNEFFSVLKEHYPKLLPKYKQLYSNNSKYGNYDYEQFKKLGLSSPTLLGYKLGRDFELPYGSIRYVPEGRNETNLKVAELLIKIAFLKRAILSVPNYESKKFYTVAKKINNMKYDLGKNTAKKITKLKTTKEIKGIIQEFIESKSNKYLEKLEEKGYNKALQELY